MTFAIPDRIRISKQQRLEMEEAASAQIEEFITPYVGAVLRRPIAQRIGKGVVEAIIARVGDVEYE